jgi:hypothetical protein
MSVLGQSCQRRLELVTDACPECPRKPTLPSLPPPALRERRHRGLPRRLVAVRRADSLSSAQVREGLTDRRFGRFEAAPPPNPPPCACTSAARVAAARHKVRCEQ